MTESVEPVDLAKEDAVEVWKKWSYSEWHEKIHLNKVKCQLHQIMFKNKSS